MPTRQLTAKFVANAKPAPGEGRTEFTDTYRPGRGASLFLRVGKRSKSFYLKYRDRSGKSQRYKLGEYRDPGFTLADAHNEATRKAAELVDGGDPACTRRSAKAAGTVRELADRFIEEYARPKKKSWQRDRELLDRFVIPDIGAMNVREVTPRDIGAMTSRVAAKHAVQANRLHAVLHTMFRWAAKPERQIVVFNPVQGLDKPGGREEARDRHYTDHEIKRLWAGYAELPPLSRDCLRVVAATGQRPGEVMKMRSQDVEGRWWTIPKHHAKNGRAHRVYLNDIAWTIVESRLSGESPFVFPNPRDKDKPIGTLQKAHEKARAGREATAAAPARDPVHDARVVDWRTTVGTRLAAKGVGEAVIGHVLNHSQAGTVTSRHYIHYDYDQPKREALEQWGRELATLVGEDRDENVLAFA